MEAKHAAADSKRRGALVGVLRSDGTLDLRQLPGDLMESPHELMSALQADGSVDPGTPGYDGNHAVQAFLAPATRQPSPWALIAYPLTSAAAIYVRDLASARRVIAEEALQRFLDATRRVLAVDLPALSVAMA